MSKNSKTNISLEEMAEQLKVADREKQERRIKDAIALDEAREKAKKARDDKTRDDKAKTLAYKNLILKSVACSPTDLVQKIVHHALDVQGHLCSVPSGLVSILGKSVAGKSFAWQWRLNYAAGENPIVIQLDEPIPGASVSPSDLNEFQGLVDAITELAQQHKVIIVNSLTSLLIADPAAKRGSQATAGGSYAGLTAAIFRLDALAKDLGILLIGVFNTAQFKDFTVDTVVGRSTASLIIGTGFTATWSSRSYSTVESNAGLCVDEGDRSGFTLPPLERAGKQREATPYTFQDILEDLEGPGAAAGV